MGWTGLYHKPANIFKYFEDGFGGTRQDGSRVVCLGQAYVGTTIYGIWRYINPDGTNGCSWASIVLTQRGGKNDSCEWYYKDMDETVGPYQAKCPKSLLQKLDSPASNEYARDWRKRCWQHALGLTKESVITRARRVWRRNRAMAIQYILDWNKKHPEDAIIYT